MVKKKTKTSKKHRLEYFTKVNNFLLCKVWYMGVVCTWFNLSAHVNSGVICEWRSTFEYDCARC